MKITVKNLNIILKKAKQDIDLDLGLCKLYYTKNGLELSILYTYSDQDLEVYLEKDSIFKRVSRKNIEIIYDFCNNLYEEKLEEHLDNQNSFRRFSSYGFPID